jgi:hypothetical protein
LNRRAELLSDTYKHEVDPEEEREARETLRTCANLEDMYASEGWEWLTNEITLAERASVSVLEASGKDLDVIYAHRERLRLIRWLLALPSITAATRREATVVLEGEQEEM